MCYERSEGREEERNSRYISGPFSPSFLYVPLPRPLCLGTHVCRRITVIALSPSRFSNSRGLNPDFNYVDSRKRSLYSRARKLSDRYAVIFRIALERSTPYRNHISFNPHEYSSISTGLDTQDSFVLKVKLNTRDTNVERAEHAERNIREILHTGTKRESEIARD